MCSGADNAWIGGLQRIRFVLGEGLLHHVGDRKCLADGDRCKLQRFLELIALQHRKRLAQVVALDRGC